MAILCTADGNIGDLNLDCTNQRLDQLSKIVFQKRFSTGNTLNSIADPTLIASWTPLLAASDGTKVITSPRIQAPEHTPGEKRTFGGGNTTTNGIEIILGRDRSELTGMIYDHRQDTIEDLKAISEIPDMAIWLIDINGDMGCLVDDVAAPTVYYPIPIESLFIGDKGFGMYENPDSNMISCQLPGNWSDKFTVFRPADFNARIDLV